MNISNFLLSRGILLWRARQAAWLNSCWVFQESPWQNYSLTVSHHTAYDNIFPACLNYIIFLMTPINASVFHLRLKESEVQDGEAWGRNAYSLK